MDGLVECIGTTITQIFIRFRFQKIQSRLITVERISSETFAEAKHPTVCKEGTSHELNLCIPLWCGMVSIW
jgi:hypothetical protein